MENSLNLKTERKNVVEKHSFNRLNYLDWLKALAVWLVVFVHVIYYLNMLDIGITKNEKAIIKRMIIFFSEFGMPIFFFVSGKASFLSNTSSFRIFIRKKVLRLFIPLVSGYFILLPITHFVSNGRRPCTYVSENGDSLNFFIYYFKYVKDFSCHGFEWLWFLALLIVISTLIFPFFRLLKSFDNGNGVTSNTSENENSNISRINEKKLPYIIGCILVMILVGPFVIYSYDFHPMSFFGLSFPLLIMFLTSFSIRNDKKCISKRTKALNIAMIYLSAVSFILANVILAYYSNIDNLPYSDVTGPLFKKNNAITINSINSNNNINSTNNSGSLRANQSKKSVMMNDNIINMQINNNEKILFPNRGFLKPIDNRRMLLAILFYISFYAVGFIDQLLSHYMSKYDSMLKNNNDSNQTQTLIYNNTSVASNTSLIQNNNQTNNMLNINVDSNKNQNYGILYNMPGLIKPVVVFVSLIFFSISFSLSNNGIGYMWAFPMYRIPSSSVFYVIGSWIIVLIIDNICHSLLNNMFQPHIYFHFTASSIIFYIFHMLWLEVANTYIIIPHQIPYYQSVVISFLFTTTLSAICYLLALKIKFIGFLTGMSTSFTFPSKKRSKDKLQLRQVQQQPQEP
ncbi:protein with 12x transmembrane regions [Cryptosporidium ryanae]|uniref:protein with 12x transmembrane regions n=1 Tax=Cryptosporidium ryanae TaxID=515981 RepID=UPI003519E1FF|nr:protein with 12x transmembrane regions [Cryptosporidium ryanae]